MKSIPLRIKEHPFTIWVVKRFPFLLQLRLRAAVVGRRILLPLRWLPGTSRSFGPPRRLNVNATGPGIETRALASGSNIERKLPITNSVMVNRKFTPLIRGTYQPRSITTVQNGRFVGGSHVSQVIGPDDSILFPFSPARNEPNPFFHNAFSRIKLPGITMVEKAVIVSTRCAEKNYNHWMLDHMTRFLALREAGMDFDGAILVMPWADFSFQRNSLECLNKAGFNFSSIRAIDTTLHMQARTMIIPSIINPGLNMDTFAHSPEVLHFVRDLHFPEWSKIQTKPSRRIFISRAKASRSIAAEPLLVAKLAQIGFESVCLEDYSGIQQATLFREAEIVCGFHGAGLTNIIFSPPGTKIIELFPPDFISTNFWSISNDLGHNYYAYCDDQRLVGYQAYSHAMNAPVEIDPASVAEFIFACVDER